MICKWFQRTAFVLSLLLAMGLFLLPGVQAVDSIASGGCGDGLAWVLDMNGVLTISGAGDMTNYGPSYAENISVPWAGNRADIKTVVIENGVTSIGNNAFVACSNLSNITIAESVTRIGEHAFKNCLKLEEVDLPDGVTEIGEYAFAGCRALSSIALPEGVTEIADYAFESCVGLTNVTLSKGVTAIGRNAFKYCPSLTEIVLPESITFIGRGAFEECENLGHILYTGTQEQWTAVTLRSGALPEGVGITYNYADGMDYHVFDNDCDGACNNCGFTRETAHIWDEGVTSEDSSMTFACTICGEIRVDGTPCIPTEPTKPAEPSIPAESSVPATDPVENTTPSTPQSGSAQPLVGGNVALVIVIVVVLAAGVALLIVLRKKK